MTTLSFWHFYVIYGPITIKEACVIKKLPTFVGL